MPDCLLVTEIPCLPYQDPLSDEFHALWNTTAATNAAIYQELFHCVPAKGIRTWEQYKSWVPADKPVGHIANQDRLELSYIKERLSKIRGHLVEMPTDFLEDERLWELTAEVNPITLPSESGAFVLRVVELAPPWLTYSLSFSLVYL